MNRWLSAMALGLVVMTTFGRSDEPAKPADLQRQILQLKEELVKRERTVAELTARLKDKEKLAEQERLTLQRLATTVETLSGQLKKHDGLLADQKAKVLELEAKTREYQAKAIKAEIDYLSAQDRNEKLATRLKDLDKELAKLRGSDAEPVLGRNPPAKEVKGEVKSIDQATGNITINLGSDDGLVQGNTLEVFRRKPKPIYVGVLRVLETRKNEAVGRLVQKAAAIQVGDEAVSDILGKR